MGFCSEQETERFLDDAPIFERMLVSSGLRLFKYYLDIDRHEQMVRLKERRHDPLTQWKTSPVDKLAVKHWDDYTIARDIMLRRTHSQHAPWHIVRANDKHAARLNLIRHLLAQLHYKGKERKLLAFDRAIILAFDEARLKDGSLLMNLGGLSTMARYRPKNLVHVVFDNESLLSVGGFPTATSTGTDLDGIARAAGVPKVSTVKTIDC